jgi:hypothetical protein
MYIAEQAHHIFDNFTRVSWMQQKTNVWAFGNLPLDSMHSGAPYHYDFDDPERREPPIISLVGEGCYSRELRNLVVCCCRYRPEHQPTFSQILRRISQCNDLLLDGLRFAHHDDEIYNPIFDQMRRDNFEEKWAIGSDLYNEDRDPPRDPGPGRAERGIPWPPPYVPEDERGYGKAEPDPGGLPGAEIRGRARPRPSVAAVDSADRRSGGLRVSDSQAGEGAGVKRGRSEMSGLSGRGVEKRVKASR